MIAVTGATGFIGRTLCGALRGSGRPVREIRRQGSSPPGAGQEVASVAGLTRGDLRTAFQGAEVVIHLAGVAHRLHASAVEELAAFRSVNVMGTRAAVEAAADAGVRRVLVASSVKAVGDATSIPWTEDTPPHPTDPYGRSKLEAEEAALEIGRRAGLEVVILRFPLVYGPDAPANVRRLIGLVARGWPLPFGAVRNRRSTLYTGNLVAAVERLTDQPGLGGETFFVADGVDLSTPELIRSIAEGLGRPARLVSVPALLLRAGGIALDLLHRAAGFPLNSSDLERLTGSLCVSTRKLEERTGFLPPFAPRPAWAATAALWRGSER